jgi:predicted PurR-regulated permease PerM
MGRAVGLSPVIIIFSILIGAKLLGLLGVVLAIPAAGAISVILEEWPKLRGFKDD